MIDMYIFQQKLKGQHGNVVESRSHEIYEGKDNWLFQIKIVQLLSYETNR